MLATQEFVSTLGAVLGGQMTSTELTLLFRRMDANLDDEVDWDEFSDFMLLKSMSRPGSEDLPPPSSLWLPPRTRYNDK